MQELLDLEVLLEVMKRADWCGSQSARGGGHGRDALLVSVSEKDGFVGFLMVGSGKWVVGGLVVDSGMEAARCSKSTGPQMREARIWGERKKEKVQRPGNGGWTR